MMALLYYHVTTTADMVTAAHLLPDGLQVLVPHDVLPELDPGQSGASGV